MPACHGSYPFKDSFVAGLALVAMIHTYNLIGPARAATVPHCPTNGSLGNTSTICQLDNPIVQSACTLEINMTTLSVIVPCNTGVTLTTRDYRPGNYIVTFNFTDIYGQTAQIPICLALAEPLLDQISCELALDGLTVYCPTNLDDHVVMLTYNCSYDSETSLPCSRNTTINTASFTPGFHNLTVTIMTEGGQTSTSELLTFEVARFGLNCTVVESRTITVQCEGIYGVIDKSEVTCIYDFGQLQEKCELPVTIDFMPYDRNPGDHNITIVANSTMGEMANHTMKFHVPRIECVQLSMPGIVTIICRARVMLDSTLQPLCLFDIGRVNIACRPIRNFVIVPSELPFTISELPLPTRVNLTISVFDQMGVPVETTLQVQFTEEQLVECSTTVNCSSNSRLMSARECCVNNVDGRSYSIPGQQQCHTCIVFGWFQNSFVGIEQDSSYSLMAGYLKGAEQTGADVRLILNVMLMISPATSTADMSDISLETMRIRVTPMGDSRAVVFTLLPDGIAEPGGNESLNLELIPTPSTLQTMPIGEGVFFKHIINLTIIDANLVTGPTLGNNVALIGGVVGAALAVLFAVIVILLVTLCVCHRYHIAKKRINQDNLYCQRRIDSGEKWTEISVKSSFQLGLPSHLIFPSSSIKLNETIGQGEFGIVYKGYIKKVDLNSVDEYLAIKTLKGFYDRSMVRDMLKECLRMSSFDHLHVLTLKGVCLDGGPAPYIIMPFMANGSLLAYLRKNRKTLVVSNEKNDDVEMVRKQLMDMCIQVAKGMEYLASMKVVHRDLAARNCMIDVNFVIKVADFGLSESVGVKEYFRQDETSVRLPLKWLPPESINDYIFSEKSDVWAYGVTCWEIFSGGKVPYAEVALSELPKLLADGYRLEKPSNNACSEEMDSFMQQCWSREPEHRPPFSQLVESLSHSLEAVAGYVHIGAFGFKTQNATVEDAC